MEATFKKRGNVVSSMGRPIKGALSSYPKALREMIKSLRSNNEGWGAISILVELEHEYHYSIDDLPNESTVNRFLKEEGFIKKRDPKGKFPVTNCKKPKGVHELWEMDAEGATFVKGLNYQSMINIKDSVSKKYCMSFPVDVKNVHTQPSTIHYKWALRLAFIESGLPKAIQVDKDSVFFENNSKSPFPSRIHLWLIALGVKLCFIDRPPPAQNAMVERSHQTLNNQVIKGKVYSYWGVFFKNCNKRRKRLNEQYPSRTLKKQAPLQAFPKAIHSGQPYSLKEEYSTLKLHRIYTFIEKGKWYRKASSKKGIKIGRYRYYLKNATPGDIVGITFSKKSKQLIFRDVNELELHRLPIQGISKEVLMDGDDAKNLDRIYKQLFKARDFPLNLE